jgi:hypothetical protein
VDELLQALEECAEEPAHSQEQLQALARLRDACARRPGQRVAWCFEP